MRIERNLQQAEKDRLIVLLTKNAVYMICDTLFLFCNPYFLQCYSNVFMIYVLLWIFAFLYGYCKYIYYYRFFGDKQYRFCKKIHRRACLFLFKNMLIGNAAWSFWTSYSFFFHSLLYPDLFCSSAEVTIKSKFVSSIWL